MPEHPAPRTKTGAVSGVIHPPAERHDAPQDPRGPRRSQGRRARPWRVRGPHCAPLPTSRPHPVPQRGTAHRRRHRRERADPHRQGRPERRAAADVQQRRLPDLAEHARRAHAVLRTQRRRRRTALRAPGHRNLRHRVRLAGLPARRLRVPPQGDHLPPDPRRGRQLCPGRRGGGRVPRPAGGRPRPALPLRQRARRDSRGRRGRGRRPRRVRGEAVPLRPADLDLLPARPVRRRRLAGRQLPLHLQHRRLQRDHLRERAPAAHRAPVHAGHRRVRDELPAQGRRGRAGDRALPVVPPQRRLRRDRLLPRRQRLRDRPAARPHLARPQGTHHGAPEKARERSRRRFDRETRVEWKIIAVDTRRRLVPSEAVLTAAAEAGPADPEIQI